MSKEQKPNKKAVYSVWRRIQHNWTHREFNDGAARSGNQRDVDSSGTSSNDIRNSRYVRFVCKCTGPSAFGQREIVTLTHNEDNKEDYHYTVISEDGVARRHIFRFEDINYRKYVTERTVPLSRPPYVGFFESDMYIRDVAISNNSNMAIIRGIMLEVWSLTNYELLLKVKLTGPPYSGVAINEHLVALRTKFGITVWNYERNEPPRVLRCRFALTHLVSDADIMVVEAKPCSLYKFVSLVDHKELYRPIKARPVLIKRKTMLIM